MASDQLFRRRKAKKSSDLRRSSRQIEPYDLVLIVCEGGKTEANYLQELCDFYRLSTANIRIIGEECGSAPSNVVEHALAEYRKEKKYNHVFCVFDKDRHSTYKEALVRIKQVKLNRDHTIEAITSVPCFEIWLLMHFVYTTKAFGSKSSSGSICKAVASMLKSHIKGYSKGMTSLFPSLANRLENALQHAANLELHCNNCGSDNPSTRMHHMVEYLRDLKKQAPTSQ